MAYITERSPDIINPTAPIDDGRDPSMQPDSAKYTVYAAEVETVVRGLAEEVYDARGSEASLPARLTEVDSRVLQIAGRYNFGTSSWPTRASLGARATDVVNWIGPAGVPVDGTYALAGQDIITIVEA